MLFCFGAMYSQSNNSLTVFTEGGERFYLILNGVKQNTTSETNVKATGINGEQVKAKVIFDQQGIPDCDKTVPMMWAAELVSNTEFVFSIKKNKKGQYKWDFVSQSPIQGVNNVINTNNDQSQNNFSNNSQNTNQNLNTTNTNTNSNTSTNTNLNMQTNGVGMNNSVTTTTASTTTTNNANNNANGQIGINFGVNVPGINLNMNVNDAGLNNTNMNTNTNSTTTITTTTTSYTTSTGNNNINQSNNSLDNSNANQNSNQFNNAGNCGLAMTNLEYNDAKKSIEAKPFDDTRLNIAKQIADNNCMTVEQIKGIASVFSFEDNKLEFAKYAYDRCTEKKNYYKVGDIFKFDSNVNELNEYVNSKK